ncbi:MAG: YebC/PmpR family DNA-binding transcriptional regulator [Candidatus Aureabacteria bacterium]|nr:YebC/PmpR family DNA-binding transcriptional regulator [Candidatus Auribacterota bacterium]
MSGHSKWASIKHKKGAIDAKRGKIFTRLGKEITVAAKLGGGDVESNPRLRTAVQKAKESNMPADNIKRAIQKGTGELPGVSYEEVTYEGYGPGGVAVFIETTTDNRNRTVSEIRSIFTKRDGNLASAGAVSYLFEVKGYFVFDKPKVDENALLEAATEAGAEDFKDETDTIEVFTNPKDFDKVRSEFERKSLSFTQAEITKIPTTYVQVRDEKTASRLLSLIETLQDHDDVQNVYANFDIDEELLKKIESS